MPDPETCSRAAAELAWRYLIRRVDGLPAPLRDAAWIDISRILASLPHCDPDERDRRLIRAGYEAGLADGSAATL